MEKRKFATKVPVPEENSKNKKQKTVYMQVFRKLSSPDPNNHHIAFENTKSNYLILRSTV